MGFLENISGELKTRNFSIYGQWTGILAIIICFAVGITSVIASFNLIIIIFGALCIASGFTLIFVEIPILLRICPTSKKFDDFIKKFHSNYGRAGMYTVMSVVQWLSLIGKASGLIAAAIILLLAGLFYALAGVKGQEFKGSKTLGGAGVASMMV